MAIKTTLNFRLTAYGDGTATVFTAASATAPYQFNEAGDSSISTGVNLSSVAPSSVQALTTNLPDGSGGTVGVTASLGLLGVSVTYTLASAPPVGPFIIMGYMLF